MFSFRSHRGTLAALQHSASTTRSHPSQVLGQGVGNPCGQSKGVQGGAPGQGAGLAAGATLGCRPPWEWVQQLPPGEEVRL